MMRVLQALTLLAVIWLAGECAWTIHSIRPKLQYTIENANRATIAAGAAAANVEKASRAWEQASKEQSLQTTLAMKSLKDSAARLSQFVTNTDASLNRVIFPQLSAEMKEQNDTLKLSQTTLQNEFAEMSKATIQAQKVLADADAQITNPALKESVDKFAESSANLASATGHADKTMAKVEEGVTYEIKQLEAPVTKAKVVWHVVLDVIRHLYF